MELYEVTEAFSSLAQETRLRVFKHLIEFGCNGTIPGEMASALKIPDNTLSFHLAHMSKAGLVASKKNGRSVTYFANAELIEELIDYLQENCCAREKKSNLKNKMKAKNCIERKC